MRISALHQPCQVVPYRLTTEVWIGLTIIILVAIIPARLPAQPGWPGLPFLRSFEKQDYRGGTQNWEIAQSPEGILLVANNEGLLTYDGISWDKYPLPNRSIMRSLEVAPDGAIYVGGQDELGYFLPDETGILQYHSLMELLPAEALPIADVWDILWDQDRVFFRTSDRVLCYERGRLVPIVTDQLLALGGGQGRVLWQSVTAGLVEWTPQGIQPVPGGDRFRAGLITDIRPVAAHTYLISTLREGLFRLDTAGVTPWPLEMKQIQDLRIHTACLLADGDIVVATELGGVLVLNPAGGLRYTLDRTRGLPTNYVTSLWVDHHQNVWAGLSNGLSLLEIGTPYKTYIPDGPLQGAGYAVAWRGDTFYWGTANGLYAQRPPSGAVTGQLVSGSESQVWGLNEVGGQLLMGHHEGSFTVGSSQVSRNSSGETQGVWLHLPLRQHPGYVIAGHYAGIALYRQGSTGLVFERRISGFTESCRFLVEDQAGILWASHPYRGVFRISPDETLSQVSVRRYGQAEGLPSDLYNHVFFVQGEVVVAGETGLFRLNPETDHFERHPDYDTLFAEGERVIRLVEDTRGHIWYVSDRRVGVIRIADIGLRRTVSSEAFPRIAGRLVNGFELIYPVHDSLIIFGMDKGFLLFQPRSRTDSQGVDWRALISRVYLRGYHDSLIAGVWYPDKDLELKHPKDDLRLMFGATDFTAPEGLEFRFRLEGLELEWSDWQPVTGKEYTNLPPGSYVFHLQARNAEGLTSRVARLRIHISPPWYSTLGAIMVYLLLLGLLLGGLILIPRRQFEKEKAAIFTRIQSQEEAQMQELARSRQQIDHLLQEKLESEINHKTRELATATMHLVQKNEVLTHLREALEQVAARNPGYPGSQQLQEIIRMLNHDNQFDADWEQFAAHFDEVHAGFLRRLQERYPQLTPKDQRLCAYLRMNLATKEIAPLMNISVRGVEISRYRLRKKLELDSEVNLNEFMMGF